MKQRPLGHWLLFGSVVCVLFFVTIAVGVIDGPQTMRERKFDAERIARLTSVAFALDCYWQREGESLPESLQELRDWSARSQRRTRSHWYCQPGEISDPDSGAPFSYRIIASPRYELCAVFLGDEHDTSEGPYYRLGNSREGDRFRNHEAGENCFEVTAQTPFWMKNGNL